MKKKMLSRLSLVVLATLTVTATAQVRPTGSSSWYYEIGGADPYLFGYTNRTRVQLGLGANWGIGNACSFDPRAGINNTFRNAEQSLYGFFDDVVANAGSMVVGWGISKVQEINPGLYDFVTKGLADARNTYNLSVKSCHEVVNDNIAGRNPVDGWIKIAKSESWKQKTQRGSDPTTSEAEITEDPGKDGITWTHGQKAGGEGQPAINTIGDSVEAGYEHLAPSSPAAGQPADQRVTRLWRTSDVASEWVTSVVGEQQVRLCANCEKLKTRVGQGLRLQVKDEKLDVDQDLTPLLQTADAPSVEDLDAISAPGMGILITEPVIQALREEPAPERALLANRLATEIALARTIEKALVAIDLLRAGQQEANVAANAEAQTAINTSIQKLQSEIDGILYEKHVRQQVLASTARVLTERHEQRAAAADAANINPAPPSTPRIRDGGIEGN